MGRKTGLYKGVTRATDVPYPGADANTMAEIRPAKAAGHNSTGGELHLWPEGSNRFQTGRTFKFADLLEGADKPPPQERDVADILEALLSKAPIAVFEGENPKKVIYSVKCWLMAELKNELQKHKP